MNRIVFSLLAVPMVLGAQVAPKAPKTPVAPKSPATAPTPDSPWLKLDGLQDKLSVLNDAQWELFNKFDRLDDLKYNMNLDYNLSTSISNEISTAFQNLDYAPLAFNSNGLFDAVPRKSWAPNDPADSLYSSARNELSRGDYRRAADLFKSIPQKFPSSVYVADAQYYQAFALYRIGGTPELQEALNVLAARKPAPVDSSSKRTLGGNRVSTSTNTQVQTAYADAGRAYSLANLPFARSGQVDANGLAARIASVLSSRGMANDPRVKSALAAGGTSACDQEDQSVRAEALNALMQNDAESARSMATKILSRRDECSVPLRRNAVMIVGNKKDDAAVAALIPVAKSDPSMSVRTQAIAYLARMPGDAAFNAIAEAARSDDENVQRSGINALGNSSNPKARAEIKAMIERNDSPEQARINALDGFSGDKASAEDAAWLRSLYSRTTSTRIKSRIASTLGHMGGDANDAWLMTLVKNEDESLDARTSALRQAGRTMDIAALGKLYDAASQRPIRSAIIDQLAERKEPGAVDKLIDIAKNGTDPQMRREAISVLARSKDPRAAKLLLELLDK